MPALVLLTLGGAALGQTDPVAAMSCKTNPDDPRSYRMLADMAHAENHDGDALTVLRKARSLHMTQGKDATTASAVSMP